MRRSRSSSSQYAPSAAWRSSAFHQPSRDGAGAPTAPGFSSHFPPARSSGSPTRILTPLGAARRLPPRGRDVGVADQPEPGALDREAGSRVRRADVLVHGVARTAVPALHVAAARRGLARAHPLHVGVAQPLARELDRPHGRRARLAEPGGLGRSRRAVVVVAHQRHGAALARASHHVLGIRTPADHVPERPQLLAHRTPRPRRSPRRAPPRARARRRTPPRPRSVRTTPRPRPCAPVFACRTGRVRAGWRPKPHEGVHSRSSPTTRAQSAARSRIFLTVSMPYAGLVDDAGGERDALRQRAPRVAFGPLGEVAAFHRRDVDDALERLEDRDPRGVADARGDRTALEVAVADVHAARDALDALEAGRDDVRRLIGRHLAHRHEAAEDRHVELDVRAAGRGERRASRG